MNLTVIGAGYVGLVTASCFAELGSNVMCIEKMPSKVAGLLSGKTPFFEEGLSELIQKNLSANRLRFSSNVGDGISFSDVIFLCVGTPQNSEGEADLSQVEEVSRQIAMNIAGYKLIVEKSTVPVNTHLWINKTIRRYAEKVVNFDVASNPEFLREGSAVHDFLNPDRIVIGVDRPRAKEVLLELYRPLTDKGHPLLVTTPIVAELIKHASNSFLATKISYINMISDLCELVGADVKVVADGMGFDKRIGRSFLEAGLGFGGSCFPKDVKAFIKIAEEHGMDFELLKQVDKLNRDRRQKFIERIENILWVNKDKNIAIWGLSFKPGTDDIRESPAIDIVAALDSSGANLRLYDPKASEKFKCLFPEKGNIRYFDDKLEAAQGADLLVIITEWKDFVEVDLRTLKKVMRIPVMLDGRNIFKPTDMKQLGFEYYSIGRA